MKIAAIFWSILLFALPLAAQPIRLGADLFPPYNAEPRSEKPGYMIEATRKIFERAGISIDYQIMPWARAIKEAEDGQLDGIVCAGKGDAPGFVFPTRPLGVLKHSVFVLKTHPWNYRGPSSLLDLKLGAIANYSYGPTFDAYLVQHKANSAKVQFVAGSDALEQNIQKMLRGRIDGVMSSRDVFWAKVDALRLSRDDFREAGTAPESDPVYIAFSPAKATSAKYAEILSQGIEQLRASGELESILSSYGMRDWEK